jgi:hypothetical protein
MRHVITGFVLLFCIAAPGLARADRSAPPSQAAPPNAPGDQLKDLLKSLNLDMVAKAYAAECKDEGEICKTNAECCSGLECSGDPQTTCRPQE